jgi:hypothetical protein
MMIASLAPEVGGVYPFWLLLALIPGKKAQGADFSPQV